jgi:hypothetical protein
MVRRIAERHQRPRYRSRLSADDRSRPPVPAGNDRFWRLDEALGELVVRETGIWQLGPTYTLTGPARKFHDLDLRLHRIEKHLGLEPEGG